MSIDSQTIIVMNIIGTLLMSLSLFAVARGYLAQIKGVTKWATATLIQSLGWFIIGALRGIVPDVISIVLGNALLIICLVLYFEVLVDFNNKRYRSFWLYIVVGVEVIILAYFVLVTPNAAIRIVVISACSAMILFACSYVLLSKSVHRPTSHLFTASMFGIGGLILTIRCFYILLMDMNPNQSPFGTSPIHSLTFLTFFITSVMLTYCFVLMCNDKYIYESKQIEDALKASEEKFSLLAKNATDIISLHSVNLNYLYVSDSVKIIMGFEPEELIGKSVSDFIHPEDIEYVKSRYATMHSRTSIEYSKYRHKKKDGTYCRVETAANFTFDKDGKISGLVANTRDISESEKAHERILKNEKQLNDAQQLAKTGSWEMNLITFELSWSKEHYRIFELEETPPDKLYNVYRSKIHPADIPMLDTIMTNAIELGEGFSYEHRMICNDGSIKYILGIGEVIKDEHGNPIGLRGTGQDITQRKKDEEELRKSELRYRTLAEASEDMVLIVSPEGTVEYMNDFAARQFGQTVDALTGKPMADLFPENEKERRWNLFQKIFDSGQSTYYEAPTQIGESVRWLGSNLVALRDSVGKITSVMVVACDITARINAVNILKENEIFISSIVENIPNMIFVKEAEQLRFIKINKAGEELIGISRNELLNKNDYDFFPKSEADFFTSKDREVLKNNELNDIPEETIQTKFHGERILHTKKISILDADGKPKYLLGISEDITEKKRSEQELIIAKELAEKLALDKDRFLSNMSHEIRTPLNGIIGFADVLMESELTKKQKQQLEIIKMSGDILLVLVNDILDLAKMNEGKMTLDAAEFNLSDVVNKILATFELRIAEKELIVNSQFDKNIPRELMGDPIRISQILINLINNSIKFTNKGGKIDVNVRLHEDNIENANIELIISDTGIGIAQEKLDTIFEPFIHSNPNVAHVFEGTGLGLSIVKKLVNLMEGTISIKSKLNEGTTISIVIPLKKISLSPVSIKKEIIPSDNHPVQLEQLRILLAEDNEINQLLAQTILNKFGFEVDIAGNGEIAIELLAKNQYDIILMDLKMPIMGGLEATKYIRNNMKPPQSLIPIIALTADVTKAEIDKYNEVGINDYIIKPYKQMDLLNKIIQQVKEMKSGS